LIRYHRGCFARALLSRSDPDQQLGQRNDFKAAGSNTEQSNAPAAPQAEQQYPASSPRGGSRSGAGQVGSARAASVCIHGDNSTSRPFLRNCPGWRLTWSITLQWVTPQTVQSENVTQCVSDVAVW
jgi:hypothetical protein